MQLSLEKEEQERQELRKMIMGEGADQDQRKGKDKKKDDDDNQSLTGYSSQPGEGPSCLHASVERKTLLVELHETIAQLKNLLI
jgi:hypothetical protein